MKTLGGILLIGLLVGPALAQTDSPATSEREATRSSGEAGEGKEPAAGGATGTPAVSPGRPAVRTADMILFTRVPSVAFDETPLDAALDELARIADTNVVVRWSVVESAGIARDTPVTLRLRDVGFGQTLELVLQTVATEDAPLAYRASNNLVVISTAEAFADQMVTRLYDVRDLIMPEPAGGGIYLARVHDIPITTTPVVGAGVVAQRPVVQSYGSGTFLRLDQGRSENRDRTRELSERNLRQLIEAITGTVDPETWAVNGGRGSIRVLNGVLIVRNSPLVHQKLANPLLNPPQP